MRIYHSDILEVIPRLQLLCLHRECCRIRSTGWGKCKSESRYIFRYGIGKLYTYHMAVIAEMHSRGYKPNLNWTNIHHKGKEQPFQPWVFSNGIDNTGYSEHNEELLYKDYEHLLLLFDKDKNIKKYPLNERYKVIGFMSNL